MPVEYRRLQRCPGVGRDEFARAVLEACRTRRANPHVRSSRYYWADGGTIIVILTEGDPQMWDYNPAPDPLALKTVFSVDDVALQLSVERLSDAGSGTEAWNQAGQPTGRR